MKFFTRLMVIAALLTMAVNVKANDYLEVQRHYQVYSNGRNSIHFKIPVWAYGRINDYHLDSAFTTIRWQVLWSRLCTWAVLRMASTVRTMTVVMRPLRCIRKPIVLSPKAA